MKVRLALFVAFVLAAGTVFAQATTPQARPAPRPAAPALPAPPAPVAQPAPPPPPPPPPAPREGQPINVRVELTITEEGGSAPPIKKTVSALIGDSFNGFVRAQAGNVPLNFDAYPVILANGKVRLTCNLEYLARAVPRPADQQPPNPFPGQPQAPGDQTMRTQIRQKIVLILESGKPLVISESTDPISDRKVVAEVKATILR